MKRIWLQMHSNDAGKQKQKDETIRMYSIRSEIPSGAFQVTIWVLMDHQRKVYVPLALL